MHSTGTYGVLPQRAGTVVHHLELVHDMEMRAQHAVGRALGEERHGYVDALVLWPLDEVGAPGEMPVGQIALDPRVLDLVVSLDSWHCNVSGYFRSTART
jgi:hypothetical protein